VLFSVGWFERGGDGGAAGCERSCKLTFSVVACYSDFLNVGWDDLGRCLNVVGGAEIWTTTFGDLRVLNSLVKQAP